MEHKGRPVKAFKTQAAFEKWLEKEHAAVDGIWIKFAKKASGIASVDYKQALDVALCFGWIDGQVNRLDDDWYLQLFTPRRPRSKWSKINTGKVEALLADGRMRPAGLEQVELAKADGRWGAAYESPSKMAVPADLEREFEKNPAARKYFEALDSTNRYAVLYRIEDAKKPETRARRISDFVAMLAEGKKLHP
jgi:uncharacterized protein YdeI (YjbR/CyaY-like superfamily)